MNMNEHEKHYAYFRHFRMKGKSVKESHVLAKEERGYDCGEALGNALGNVIPAIIAMRISREILQNEILPRLKQSLNKESNR